MSKIAPIPTLQVYGEQGYRTTTDHLHCEALITRSRQHQFKIRPHRHPGMTQIFWLARGSGDARIDGRRVSVTAPMLILISEMCVHDFAWSDDVDGTVVSVTSARLERSEQRLGGETSPLRRTALLKPVSTTAKLEALFKLLMEEFRRAADTERDQALQALIDLLAIEIGRMEAEHLAVDTQQARAAQHLQQFLRLIERDYLQHRSIDDYASELGITAPHLNQLCKQLTDHTALHLVHERLLLEAQRYLYYSAQRVSEIAYQLGFSDPAYFSRFFRRMTGLTPKAFRQQSPA